MRLPGHRGRSGLRRHVRAGARRRRARSTIEWEQLEALLDPDEAVARKQFVGEPRERARGDLEAGLAEADVVVEGEYRTQVVLHSSMETHQSVVQWLGDTLEIYISTQYIWGVRDEVAEALGIPADKVRVDLPLHGRRLRLEEQRDDYTFIAIELAKRTHRPVRCALTRREENLATGNRNATIQRLTIGAKADGTLTALGGEYVNATGWGGWSSPSEGPMQQLYSCPNVKTTTLGGEDQPASDEGVPRAGVRRGHLRPRVAARRARSEARHGPARTAAQELRRQRPSGEKPFSSKNLMECYRRAEPHWERRHEVRARSTETVKRGVGMASQIWYGGGGPPSYAWIRVGSDGRATVVTAMQDIGTGTKTAMAQIAAEELGHPARPRDRHARRLGARAVRVVVRGLVDDAVDGPGRACRGGGCKTPDHRDRRAALRPRGARARHRSGHVVSADGICTRRWSR